MLIVLYRLKSISAKTSDGHRISANVDGVTQYSCRGKFVLFLLAQEKDQKKGTPVLCPPAADALRVLEPAGVKKTRPAGSDILNAFSAGPAVLGCRTMGKSVVRPLKFTEDQTKHVFEALPCVIT